MTHLKRSTVSAGLIVAAVVAVAWWSAPQASVAGPIPKWLGGKRDKNIQPAVTNATPTTPQNSPWNEVVAEVNGEPIRMGQLAKELVDMHGKKHLETIINRKLVEQACQDKKVEISRAEVEAEIAKTLKKLNVNRKEFKERVLARRGISYEKYIRDTVWPSLALRKLVIQEVEVTNDDLSKAFEANFGEKVECRMLMTRELRRADELYSKINGLKKVEDKLAAFEDACKIYSIDHHTRLIGGKIPLIHRHSSNPRFEKEAFKLKPGEMSGIIQVPDGNLILFCVQKHAPAKGLTLDSKNPRTNKIIKDELSDDLFEKKVKYEIAQYFNKLRETGKINNFTQPDFDNKDVQPASHTAPAQPGK